VGSRVVVHPLPGGKRAGELARLTEALLRRGRRLVIWVGDEGRRQMLDDYLWTFDRLSFVPHALWKEGQGEVEDPVVLLGVPGNPNRAEVLLVGDEAPAPAWAASFEEVHDLAPPGPEGEARRRGWHDAGFDVAEAEGASDEP
jgi:DNA polymerase III subunit chi